jgi:hypothetical protein
MSLVEEMRPCMEGKVFTRSVSARVLRVYTCSKWLPMATLALTFLMCMTQGAAGGVGWGPTTEGEPTAVGADDSGASADSGTSDAFALVEMASACGVTSACASKIGELTQRRAEDAVAAAGSVLGGRGSVWSSAPKGDGDGFYRLVLLLGQVMHWCMCPYLQANEP